MTGLWASRLAQLARARDLDPYPALDLAASIGQVLDLRSRAEVWAGLYALAGRVPPDALVTETLRRAEFDGSAALLETLGGLTVRQQEVEVVAGRVLVDVGRPTGRDVDRVVTETLARWGAHEPTVVRWREDGAGLVRVDPEHDDDADRPVVVPLEGCYVGLGQDLTWDVQGSLLSLVHSSGMRTAFLGYDCSPLTCVETMSEGVPSAFANRLAALRHSDRVVALSQATATELRGWTRMLGGAGIAGPEVVVVAVAQEKPRSDGEIPTGVLPVESVPVALVVGDDEPRLNHAAVHAAAERLRAEGHDVVVVVAGGDVAEAALGRLYETARFTVLPSLYDGIGLPVAESLASGTPVITSDFGSMREIAARGGALSVDPRDDDAVTDAMRSLLTDDALLAELGGQARSRPARTWDDYADEAWQALTQGPAQPRSTATAAS